MRSYASKVAADGDSTPKCRKLLVDSSHNSRDPAKHVQNCSANSLTECASLSHYCGSQRGAIPGGFHSDFPQGPDVRQFVGC